MEYGCVLALLSVVGTRTSPSFTAYATFTAMLTGLKKEKDPHYIKRQKFLFTKISIISIMVCVVYVTKNDSLIMCIQTDIYMYLCSVCNLF